MQVNKSSLRYPGVAHPIWNHYTFKYYSFDRLAAWLWGRIKPYCINHAHALKLFASSSSSQPTRKCKETAGVQSTKQAQAITNRFLLSEGPRPEQMLPDFPQQRDSRVLTLYGFDKQGENRCWGWNIRNGGGYTEKSLRYDGVSQLQCFEEDGRGNMKGSRFLWRQVGFSRRSRIFPRNPTPRQWLSHHPRDGTCSEVARPFLVFSV